MARETAALLTPAQMAEADRLTIACGRIDGHGLMTRAGEAVVAALLARYPAAAGFDVLCGPGNNGGDGYVVARLLAAQGLTVALHASAPPRPGSDAARAAADCPLDAATLDGFAPRPGRVVVDALFGAGLARGLGGAALDAAIACRDAGATVAAVDLPSGVNGESSRIATGAFAADLTVTFACLKPGHLLQPGRAACGEIVVADIGIGDAEIEAAAAGAPPLAINRPQAWKAVLPRAAVDAHKYSRGHVAVFSGGPTATGAARLAALAAARAGAGAVTVLSPANALLVNAAHLTSIMLRETGSMEDVAAFVAERRPRAMVFGPGLEPKPKVAAFLVDLIGHVGETDVTLVVDASAITAAAVEPGRLFEAATTMRGASLVLTPHDGEFARLFPDLAGDPDLSKVERARRAAARAQAVVVCKGPDTVVAAPDGRAVVNANGVPWLATAGSGDVLAGLVAGLAAQGMPAFEAACAAVWIHAEAASRFGHGLVAEDLPLSAVAVIQELLGADGRAGGRGR